MNNHDMKNNTENILDRNQSIKKAYLDGLDAKRDSDALIEEIADSNKIGKFYVRSILKDQKVAIVRKEQYSRKDEEQLQTRNQQIMDRFDAGDEPEIIAEKFGLTVTRIRQLLKGKIVKSSKLPKLNHIRAEIESKIEDDVPYLDIVEEYGKSMIKQLRYNLDFNVFQIARLHMRVNMVNLIKGKGVKSKKNLIEAFIYVCFNAETADEVKRILSTGNKKVLDARKTIRTKNKSISKLFGSRVEIKHTVFIRPVFIRPGYTTSQIVGSDVMFARLIGPLKEITPDMIAHMYNVTRHYVYTLLHEHGVRFRLGKRDKAKRDKEIASAYKHKEKIEKIALEHDLTPTMVRIILNGKKKPIKEHASV